MIPVMLEDTRGDCFKFASMSCSIQLHINSGYINAHFTKYWSLIVMLLFWKKEAVYFYLACASKTAVQKINDG